MDVILVDLVSDSNRVEGCIAEDATLHSLSDLVSSDDSTILSSDRQNEIQSTTEEDGDHRRRRRHVSRMSGTEISIIACSSPEIKALVQPAVPPSIQCQHQRSVSTLSIFLEDDDADLFCDTYNAAKMKRDRHPVVSPDHEYWNGNRKPNDFRLSIEHRDQETCRSEGRFVYDDEPTPVASNTSHKKAVDELAVRLERQRIEPPRIYYSTAEVPNKDIRDSSHPHNKSNTINNTHQKQKPVRRRSSMHRRVSYDNLPDLSEIYCHPDLQSTNET